jgi:hypothetical protein
VCFFARQAVSSAKGVDACAQFALLTFRSAHVTQRSLAAAVVRPTAIRNGSRDMTNCRIGIVMGRPCNRFTSATVTTDKP